MENNKVYAYCRISTQKQSLQRQIDNIEAYDKNAIIFKEAYSGTKIEGRKEFKKLLNKVKKGDTIIFDSVSRMSRNAEEGIELYMKLFDKGINLVFLKEQHINTDTYRGALGNAIQLTNTDVDCILSGINEYMKKLAKQQIRIAFEQSEKEVKDLQQRTAEGIRAKKALAEDGLIEFSIGRKEGAKVTTKKSIEAKKVIQKHSKDFDGTLKDTEVIKLIGISRNSYYKYKKELTEELQQKEYEGL